MNKIFIVLISIIVLSIAIFLGVQTFKTQNEKKKVENQIALSETIEDDCTEEWKELNAENTLDLQVNTQEQERLSPNCSFTFLTKYTDCGHTSRKYINIPEQLVNATEEEVKNQYQDYEITKFSSNEVTLEREQEGECGEHYVLRDINGKIVIYSVKNGKEEEFEKTEISTDYITETDKITLKNGLEVYGKENLNQAIEDFE